MLKHTLQCTYFLLLTFVCTIDCWSADRSVHGTFLSDLAAERFWKDFITDRFSNDYIASIQVELRSSKDPISYNGSILHKSGNFVVEFAGHDGTSRKFLVTRNKLWSNVGECSDDQCTFVPDIQYGPGDLLLPIVCIDSPEYFGPKKICGRMTQQFVVRVPEKKWNKEVEFIKFSIDGAFHQPLQIEYLDKNMRVVRYQSLERLKKNGSSWVPKTFELVDVATRKRVRITLSKFEIHPGLDEAIFSEKFLENHSFLQRP